MLKETSELEFIKFVDIDESSLEIHEITASFYNCLPVYILYFNDKLEATVGFCLYKRNNKFIHPNHYHYSSLWIKGNLLNKSSRSDFNKALSSIVKEYKEVTFRLLDFPDLRAFINNKFDIDIKYTFVKQTADNNYSYGIEKHYKKAVNELNLKFNPDADFNIVLESQYSFLKGKRIKLDENFGGYLRNLYDKKTLICYSVEHKDKISGSGIILLNRSLYIANFLFCSANEEFKSAINAFMYIESQKYLQLEGIKEFDYMGANLESVSEFKHTLHPNLKPYFVIRYSALSNKIREVFFIIKRVIKF